MNYLSKMSFGEMPTSLDFGEIAIREMPTSLDFGEIDIGGMPTSLDFGEIAIGGMLTSPNLGGMLMPPDFGEIAIGGMLMPPDLRQSVPNHFNPTFEEIFGNEPMPRRVKKVRKPGKLPNLSETEKESWEMLKAMIFTIIEEMKTNPESAPLVRHVDRSFKQIIGSNDTFTHWFNQRLRHYKLKSSTERVNQKKVSIEFLNDLYKYIEQRL